MTQKQSISHQNQQIYKNIHFPDDVIDPGNSFSNDLIFCTIYTLSDSREEWLFSTCLLSKPSTCLLSHLQYINRVKNHLKIQNLQKSSNMPPLLLTNSICFLYLCLLLLLLLLGVTVIIPICFLLTFIEPHLGLWISNPSAVKVKQKCPLQPAAPRFAKS